jgi:thiol:disulfide interchange protein/DsbC/DsbD-like thiol-disulfide interchange protein
MNQQSVDLYDLNGFRGNKTAASRLFKIIVGLLVLCFCILQTQAQTLDFSKKSNKTDFLSSNSKKVSTTYSTAQVNAELMLYAPKAVQAGSSFYLGLKLSHAPHWHTYWKNPGDSGLPTELKWTLPTDWTASETIWPLAKKIPIGPLANFGYENEVLLLSAIKVPANFDASSDGPVVAQLHAKWLVCSKECIPQEGLFEITIPLLKPALQNRAEFEQALAQVPSPLKSNKNNQIKVNGSEIELQLNNLPVAWQGKKLTAMPETAEIIQMTAEPVQEWKDASWRIKVPLSAYLGSQPQKMAWVITPVDLKPSKQTPAFRLELPVQGQWLKAKNADNVTGVASTSTTNGETQPSSAIANSATSATSASTASGEQVVINIPALNGQIQTQTATISPQTKGPSTVHWSDFLIAVASALLGGILLNLMPCVFPVLAIKILHLTQYSNTPTQRKQSAIAYTFGVVLSFLALASLLLALRAAGQGLGWGFQLQNSSFVVALAVLFVLIALNLLGLFEVGQWVPNRLANWQASHPVVNAFMTGVLAVAVASPCTAPFMGASLGFAINLPVVMALAVFFALGLGLALPYLLAGFLPAIAQYLPRPGAWMESFKQALAFPMLATTIWLIWVLGQQNGLNAATALLMCLLALVFVIWCLSQKGKAKWWLSTVGALLLIGVVYLVGPFILESSETQNNAQNTSTSTLNVENKMQSNWQVWSPQLQKQLLEQGKIVFVDYTAAWCVTCQVNKKTTLNQAEVLAAFQAKNIVLLQADWTKRDAVIEQSLAQLGRNGVPVYVFYQQGKTPFILSELLTPSQVLSAIEKY